VALVALQLLLTDPGRAPSWDEAIYLSQADGPAVWFGPQRARGIVVLIAPLQAVGVPLTGIRVILALGSAAALVAAAAAWRPLVGTRVVAAAAAVSALSWLVVFSGSEVMPNLWSALTILGAAGLAARALADDGRRPGFGALGLLAAAGCFRPVDAAVAGLALGVLGAVRTRSWRWPAWVVGAAVLGAVPWLVEMSIRFGGPLAALRSAVEVGRVGEGGLLHGVRLHLGLADGPLIGADAGPIPWVAVAWWVAVLALAVRGCIRAPGDARLAARVALVMGAALLVAYLALVGGEAPRYLLPATLLLVMAAAIGGATLARPAVVGLGVAALAWAAWQMTVLVDLHDAAVRERADARVAGALVRTLAGDGPCLVLATDAYPQIGYASGCSVRWVREDGWVDVTTGSLGPAFLVTPAGEPAGGRTPAGEAGGYVVYRLEPASAPT
jgi:hypothetical protein